MTTSTEIATIATMDEAKIQLLKNTICKGSTDDEFQLFMHVCLTSNLDPFRKQIYAVKRNERQRDGSYREVMTIQTAIDGYRVIAERTGRYAPGKCPTYEYDDQKRLISATAYVKKQTSDGTWHEVSATAYYSEYVQLGKDQRPTKFWRDMPHSQLAKCAESLCLRKCFPESMSGIYTAEEMQQSDVSVEVTPKLEDKKPVETITKEQATDINLILSYCDPEYQNSVSQYLKRSLGDNNLELIPAAMYDRVKTAALKKSEEYQYRIASQATDTVDEQVSA